MRGASNQALNEWLKLIGHYNKDLEKYTQLFKASNQAASKGNSAWKDLKNIRNVFKLNKQENAKGGQKTEPEEKIDLPDLKKFKTGIKKPQKELLEPLKKEAKPLGELKNEAKIVVKLKEEEINDPEQIIDPNEKSDDENKPKKLIRKATEKMQLEKLQKQNSQAPEINQSQNLQPLKKAKTTLNRQKTPPSQNVRYNLDKSAPQEYSNIDEDPLENKIKTADNAIQIKAANFQRKKTGLGGGHIPNNTQMETKLGLLREMIRKSIEKRPLSAETSDQKPLTKKQSYPKETIITENTPPLKELKPPQKIMISPEKRLEEDLQKFQEDYYKDLFIENGPEKQFINSIVTINSQQMDTREHFFQGQSPPQQKVSFVRPPQNFENPIFQQISRKLDTELEKPSNRPYIPPLISQLSPKHDIPYVSKTNKKTAGIEPWDQALFNLGCGDYEGAYDELLRFKDDIYLLRLMIKTGPCFEELKEKTSLKVLNRMVELTNCDFIERACLGFFKEAKQENLLNCLSLDDKNYFLNFLGS